VLLASRLEKPREVERGDTVDVLAESGGARVKTQGVAEQGGHQGSIISVRNVRSGRLFRARIESKETVIVVPGGPFGLVPEEKKS
jgi:flagella basal body P-ring formation protein FlgA